MAFMLKDILAIALCSKLCHPSLHAVALLASMHMLHEQMQAKHLPDWKP